MVILSNNYRDIPYLDKNSAKLNINNFFNESSKNQINIFTKIKNVKT